MFRGFLETNFIYLFIITSYITGNSLSCDPDGELVKNVSRCRPEHHYEMFPMATAALVVPCKDNTAGPQHVLHIIPPSVNKKSALGLEMVFACRCVMKE